MLTYGRFSRGDLAVLGCSGMGTSPLRYDCTEFLIAQTNAQLHPRRVEFLSDRLSICELALGESHCAAMNDVGTLFCWGEDTGKELCVRVYLSR